MLYPLKFKPILKQTIWGGDKLAYKSNDPKVKESIGESWEISVAFPLYSDVHKISGAHYQTFPSVR